MMFMTVYIYRTRYSVHVCLSCFKHFTLFCPLIVFHLFVHLKNTARTGNTSLKQSKLISHGEEEGVVCFKPYVCNMFTGLKF